MRLLVLPVRTAQARQPPLDKQALTDIFFGNLLQSSGGLRVSVADYITAASCGAVKEVTGEVAEWITLNSIASDHFNGKVWDRDILESVFTQNDFVINYALFDDDKIETAPSTSRNDGFVDIVLVVFEFGAGYNAYRWKMSLLEGENSPVWISNDDEIIAAVGATQEREKTKIDDFIMLPVDRLEEGRIGVVCHEILHFLGLPDLYNRADPMTGGLGQWCIMCLGCNELVPNGVFQKLAQREFMG